MKIRHNTHGWTPPDNTDPEWAERVEREAEQHTARSEAAWWKAKRRLARAEAKARTGQSAGLGKRRMARLWEEVECRREELRRLDYLLRHTGAGSQHRGRGSYRGVTNMDPL